MVNFMLNGEVVSAESDADTPLLWVLREELKLRGTKFGCGIAQCGACTVHIDGSPMRSCVTPVSAVSGKSVTTIEGLATPVGEALKTAWTEAQVPQCGYCQSLLLFLSLELIKHHSLGVVLTMVCSSKQDN